MSKGVSPRFQQRDVILLERDGVMREGRGPYKIDMRWYRSSCRDIVGCRFTTVRGGLLNNAEQYNFTSLTKIPSKLNQFPV